MPQVKIPESKRTVWGPDRQWWVNSPGPRLPILFDEGVTDFVFTQKTYAAKPNMRMSPSKSVDTWSRGRPWRSIVIEYSESVALYFDSETGWSKPIGAFPMWSAQKHKLSALEALCAHYPEPGQLVGMFGDAPALAIEGQEQRIILYNMPPDDGVWAKMFRSFMTLKRAYPHITFHIHGGKSLTRTLGTGIDSFDHPVTTRWENDQPGLLLPSGLSLTAENYKDKRADDLKWEALIGCSAAEVYNEPDRQTKSQMMYRYNLRSIKWSFAHYDKFWDMRVVEEVDSESSDFEWVPINVRYRPRLTLGTDKWLCDVCSVQNRCPYARPGAVCIVDDSEVGDLAAKFGTRNSTDIIEGLATLLQTNAHRIKRGVKMENEPVEMGRDAEDQPIYAERDVSKNLTALIDSTFDRGVVLARLLDPTIAASLGKGPKTNVINVGAAHAVSQATPQEFAAGVMAQLVEAGIDVESLTAEQFDAFLKDPNRRAIEVGGSLTDHDDDVRDAAEADDGSGDGLATRPSALRAAPGVDS